MESKKSVAICIVLILTVVTILLPVTDGFRTQCARGSNVPKSEDKKGANTEIYYFNKGVRKGESYLDNRWNFNSNGYSYTYGHYKDYYTTWTEYLDRVYGRRQSSINLFIGHGGLTTPGSISLHNNEYWSGSDFNLITDAYGNWNPLDQEDPLSIPGSIFFFATCNNGKYGHLANHARDNGARYAGGFKGQTVANYDYYYMKYFAKHISSSEGYTLRQVHDKARTDAGRAGWYCKGTKSARPFSWPSYSTNAATLNHKPAKEIDFQASSSTTYCSSITLTKSYSYRNDDGAMLFFNPNFNQDWASIKVEYKKASTSSWTYFDTYYNLRKDTSLGTYDLDSQDLVIRFNDNQVSGTYFGVRITGLSGTTFQRINTRVHVFVE